MSLVRVLETCPICEAPVEAWAYPRHLGVCLSIEMLASGGPVVLVSATGTRSATPMEQAGFDNMAARLAREKYKRWVEGGSVGLPPGRRPGSNGGAGYGGSRMPWERDDPLGPPWDERGDALG